MRRRRASSSHCYALSMDDLAVRASTCVKCPLSLTRHHVVVGSGPRIPSLVLLGEAPGKNEDEVGEPFIGRSGQLLFTLVHEETGLLREQCYVTSVVKCRPPNNRTPRAGELLACRPWWEEQLALLEPAIIVTLGNTSTREILRTKATIGELRGKVQTLGRSRVVPTYHPAAALRGGPIVVSAMREDLRVVKSLLDEVT